jgi:CRP-like cAMP-binding protein
MPPAGHTNTKNQLLSGLPQEIFDQLWPSLQRVSWSIGETVYDVGDPIENVYFVEEGVASIVTIMANGATSEVGMIGSRGMVGVPVLLGESTSTQHVIVQIPGTALEMDSSLCKAAFDRYPAFHTLVLRFIGAFLNLSAQTAACNRLHSARQRCARWLLMASDHIHSDTMPMTQEFLSSMLGVRRTGVTAIAGDLQRSGLIQYHHGSITIIDRRGLEAAACECYALDQGPFRRLL